jgi:hypothetical protein
LSILVDALPAGAPLGATESWFVDPVGRRARPYHSQLGVIFNGLGASRADVNDIAFDEHKTRGPDTSWVRALAAHAGAAVTVVPEILPFWLRDWADADHHLAHLVVRLSSATGSLRRRCQRTTTAAVLELRGVAR